MIGISLGTLEEGILEREGREWWVRKRSGEEVALEDILEAYKGRDIRLTVVDLEQAERLQQILGEDKNE